MGLVDIKKVNINTQNSATNNYANVFNTNNAYFNLFALPNPFLTGFNYSIVPPMPQLNTNIFSIFNNKLNNTTPFNFSNFGNLTQSTRLSGNMGNDIVATAKKYIGYKESDGSYKKFTGGRTEAWCADFVTYVTREAFRANGKSVPAGFGSSSVAGLKQWGKKNGCYLDVSSKNKASTIKSNVKPGDIVIFSHSHTGVVDKVFADGSIQTIEGNTSDKVGYRKYAANNSKISGFVQIA